MNRYMRVGEALLHYGLVTKKQLNRALKIHAASREKLGEVLIRLGYVSEREVIACIAEQFGYEVIDPAAAVPTPASLEVLPARFSIENNVLPLRVNDTIFWCAISDPIDINLTDTLQQMTKRSVEISLSEKEPLSVAVRKAYAAEGIDLSLDPPDTSKSRTESNSAKRKKAADKWDREALLALAAQIPLSEPRKGWFGRNVS